MYVVLNPNESYLRKAKSGGKLANKGYKGYRAYSNTKSDAQDTTNNAYDGFTGTAQAGADIAVNRANLAYNGVDNTVQMGVNGVKYVHSGISNTLQPAKSMLTSNAYVPSIPSIPLVPSMPPMPGLIRRSTILW